MRDPTMPTPQTDSPEAATRPPRKRRIACFLAAALFFSVSLLAVFRAPNTLLWMLAIGATDYGHWLVIAPLSLLLIRIPFVPGPGTAAADRTLHRLTLGFCAVACLLLLTPAARAFWSAPALVRELSRCFPPGDVSRPGPLSFTRLWLGRSEPLIDEEEHVYSNQAEQPPLRLLFTRSQERDPAPCVLVLHTGGWNNGTPAEFRAMNSHLARRGYATASIQYRLAPRWTWPAQRDDVRAALDYLRHNARTLGLDPDRVVLLGRSAGGQIAQAAAYGLQDPAIRGVIAFYAPADLHFAYRYARSDDVLNSLQLLRDYLGGDPGARPENYDSASGIGLVTPESVPTLLMHGKRDELVWVQQSRRLHTRLDEAGVKNAFLELDWATHAFDHNPHGPGGQLSAWAVERFLNNVTRPGPAPAPTAP
jgi:acetyl esterase/lipase